MGILSIVLSVLLLVPADNDPVQLQYIRTYSGIAVSEMQRSGVPASITLAQGLLESRAGQSELAVAANNHFGIKCHNDWKGEMLFHDDDEAGECFRVYDDPQASFVDHSDFLRYRDRYQPLFKLKTTDYKGWAKGLKKAGYATDPKYADKLIRLIEQYELYRFDSPVVVEEPEILIADKPKSRPAGAIEYREDYSFPTGRTVYVKDKAEFVYSLYGESYESIAREYNLFLKEILRYNGLRESRPLEPGTPVYLTKPRKR